MYSIAFPNIFNGSTVFLNKDEEAVKTNLTLLLGANKGGLFGDPAYGTKLKHILFEQAHNDIIKDIIKDDIYTAIYSYMPQITVDRSDISLNIYDNYVSATIKVKSDVGVKSNLYEITLLASDTEQK